MKNSIIILFLIFFVAHVEQARSQSYEKQVTDYLEDLVLREELSNQDLDYIITNDHISSISGVRHIYFSQVLNGIPIINTESAIHLSKDKKTTSTNNRFVKYSRNKVIGGNIPVLDAIEAVKLAANQLNYTITEPVRKLEKDALKNGTFWLSKGGFSEEDIPARLLYWLNDEEQLVLVWDLKIYELGNEHWWSILVDATSGELIRKIDNVISCTFDYGRNSEKELNYNSNLYDIPDYEYRESNLTGCTECYEVFEMPLDSPHQGDRTIAINPAHPVASPFGWHDTDGVEGHESTETFGNNVDAHNPFGYRPDAGESLSFTNYEFGTVYTSSQPYTDASITNLFYWSNMLHDLLYVYGFDENSRNFQRNNYGKGGEENDEIIAYGQGISHPCRASYHHSQEGMSSGIKINLCEERDGNFDHMVVIHEYVHGLVFRLFELVICIYNTEQMGEGWADWYATILTMKVGDTAELPRGMVTYMVGEPAGNLGVRLYPYTTDMNLNPDTYDSIKGTEKYRVGSTWTAMLWEVTWGLINRYGFDEDFYNYTGNVNDDAGNIMALAIVTEGMKYTSCQPGFVDARDGILRAASAIYNEEVVCIVWEAFAKRGLGFLAFQGSPNDIDDGWESFDLPPETAALDVLRYDVCAGSSIITGLRGGTPIGGVYSGPGIIDEGNGTSFSFDPQAAGIGEHTIFYHIEDSQCTTESNASDTLNVFLDEEPPNIDCREDLIVTIPSDQEEYVLVEILPSQFTVDNCPGGVSYSQDPVAGTIVYPGVTEVTVFATDASGNSDSCITRFIVQRELLEGESLIELHPNPTRGTVILTSRREVDNLKVTILDTNNRLMGKYFYNKFGFSNTISLKNFTPGLYFIIIESEEISQNYKILRK